MSTELAVITNNVPRDIIWGYEMSPKDREEFDYIDWNAVDEGQETIEFVRYKGQMYDLQEFMSIDDRMQLSREYKEFGKWDGYMSDTFFSGILVKYVDPENDPQVIMGRYYT